MHTYTRPPGPFTSPPLPSLTLPLSPPSGVGMGAHPGRLPLAARCVWVRALAISVPSPFPCHLHLSLLLPSRCPRCAVCAHLHQAPPQPTPLPSRPLLPSRHLPLQAWVWVHTPAVSPSLPGACGCAPLPSPSLAPSLAISISPSSCRLTAPGVQCVHTCTRPLPCPLPCPLALSCPLLLSPPPTTMMTMVARCKRAGCGCGRAPTPSGAAAAGGVRWCGCAPMPSPSPSPRPLSPSVSPSLPGVGVGAHPCHLLPLPLAAACANPLTPLSLPIVKLHSNVCM